MEIKTVLESVKKGSRILNSTEQPAIDKCLQVLSDTLVDEVDGLLRANAEDLRVVDVSNPLYDRLLLTTERVESLAKSVRDIAALNSPVDSLLEEKQLSNGLILKRISAPLGVVGVIFEARPNVVVDIFSLCFKTKNACILKGGSDAENTNKYLIKIIKKVLKRYNLESVVELLSNDRAILKDLLKANDYVDVVIPRGSQSLIEFVRANATVPVIETGAGVVHIYIDESGDLKKAQDIVLNAKTSRPSVCNALDTLVVHRSLLSDLPSICAALSDKRVDILADEESFLSLQESYPSELLSHAQSSDFGREFLSLSMAIKTVSDINEALEHINKFSSRHSEAIVTEDVKKVEKFMRSVDAACVYHNASTRFTDGGEFGFGAEVGISTQKLHVRGPMGLNSLTTYKWLIYGNGQVR